LKGQRGSVSGSVVVESDAVHLGVVLGKIFGSPSASICGSAVAKSFSSHKSLDKSEVSRVKLVGRGSGVRRPKQLVPFTFSSNKSQSSAYISCCLPPRQATRK